VTVTKAHEGQQYRAGDTITLVKGDDRLVREVLLTPGGIESIQMWTHDEPNHWRFINWLLLDGWTITDVKPKPEPLPTEPGYYLSAIKNVWLLGESGRWMKVVEDAWFDAEYAAAYAPFTRLAPEADTRREVLDWINAQSFCPPWWEIVTMGDALTKVAYVYEWGDVYLPDATRLDWDTATRRTRLIRETDLESVRAEARAEAEANRRGLKPDIDGLVDALRTFPAEMSDNELDETIALAADTIEFTRSRAGKAEAERDALAAVIERNGQYDEALFRALDRFTSTEIGSLDLVEAVESWRNADRNAVPSVVLAERDARIRKQALLDAAEEIERHWAPDTAEGEEIVEGSAELLRARASRPRTDDAHETEAGEQ